MAAVTICSDFGAPPKIKYVTFHCFPIYLPWNDGTRCHDLHFLNVGFLLSALTLIKRLFNSSSLSDIRLVSSAYLRLLIFLPAILILAWASFSPAFCMMYSAYKGFPHSSVGKESTCNAGDTSSIPGLGRSPREGLGYPLQYSWASLVAQLVKNLPAMEETWVQSLGWEDPLEEGKANHSGILA